VCHHHFYALNLLLQIICWLFYQYQALLPTLLIKVNSIENQADDIFDLSIEMLFEHENNFKEVIKKREIYQSLETATDKCEDAANVIESIIIKYS